MQMLRFVCSLALAALFGAPAHGFIIPSPQPTVPVVEFYNVYLDHYFLTATPDEMTSIDHGSAGPGWVRTGWTFQAYPKDAPTASGYFYCPANGCGTPVARFYGKPGGPNSHFYTADPAEAAGLEVPQSEWRLERNEFRIDVPSGKDGAGTCASGLVPVYRLYNNGFALHTDGNHRYVTDAGERAKMQAKGWIDEGVRFCAYAASLAAVKSYLVAVPLTGKVLPSAQCEDETRNLGPCVAVNNLPPPPWKYTFSSFPPDTSPFFNLTGTHSNYVFVADLGSPAASEFVQFDEFVVNGAALFGIHIDSTKRFGGNLSSINPLYQFHTSVQPGTFDDRFFPWTGYEAPTELRVSYTLNVKTISSTTPGGGAYGHPTLEFIDTKSNHHLYFTAGTYQTMPLVHGNFLAIDGGTGKVIVGSTLRTDSNYFRIFGLGTLPMPPSGFVAQDPWGYGGYFEFRMNRDEFQNALDDGRKLDPALSGNPDDYIVDNFHFNNEVAGDGEIGINLANYKLEVWKR